MKTAEDLKQEILPWVRGADRYNQNMESHLEYAANEIVELSKRYAANQVAVERERIKTEIYRVFGDSVVENHTRYELQMRVRELIDSL